MRRRSTSKRGDVRFENVRFGYEPGREILKGLDLDIPAGTSLRDRRPVGRGQVDHRAAAVPLLRSDRRAHPDRRPRHRRGAAAIALRAAIGIVPQDTVLFNDTIGYNIAYGATERPQDEIEAAAQRGRDRPLHRRASARNMNRWSASAV